ncbi:hypothetical protein V7S43_011509 [Phytophthora oleae]|uniref:AMP-dependent synthetase/ligase domain-containing protein n=1 Tax=Phytophthora oleae TaxID=2107226 RepID=A0ABD3FA30_9STRA
MLAGRILRSHPASFYSAAPVLLRYRGSLREVNPRINVRSFSKIVHESPHPAVEVPNKTLWDILGDQQSGHADKPAFIDGLTNEYLTFQQLHVRARRFAIALAKDGVTKGDAVIIHSFNCLDYPTAVLGTYLMDT